MSGESPTVANVSEDVRIKAAQHVLASIFASQRTLKTLAPEFRWSGLGNLLGDFGELIAISAYQLQKATGGSSNYDAKNPQGATVQIKTNFAASQIGFRGSADILLVLNITEDGNWTEVYYGPFSPVLESSRKSARDNKNMIAISNPMLNQMILFLFILFA